MSEFSHADVIDRRKDRVIAILLGMKEREVDHLVPSSTSLKLRKIILDQMNDFSDFVIDIVKSLEDGSGSVLNEHYFLRLEKKLDDLLERHG